MCGNPRGRIQLWRKVIEAADNRRKCSVLNDVVVQVRRFLTEMGLLGLCQGAVALLKSDLQTALTGQLIPSQAELVLLRHYEAL